MPKFTMQCVSVVFLFLPPLTLHGAIKKPPAVEYRRHFQVSDRDNVPLYEVTELVRLSEEKDENYIWIRDEGHGDFILSKVWTFDGQRSTSRLSDIKNRSFIQASYVLPFTSKTRSATMTGLARAERSEGRKRAFSRGGSG